MSVLLSSVTELSLTNALERVVGPTFITLSYAASRVQRLRRPELSCDLGRYAGVLRQYEVSKRSREHCHVFYTDLMTHWSARSSLSWSHVTRCCSLSGTRTPSWTGRRGQSSHLMTGLVSLPDGILILVSVLHCPVAMQQSSWPRGCSQTSSSTMSGQYYIRIKLIDNVFENIYIYNN